MYGPYYGGEKKAYFLRPPLLRCHPSPFPSPHSARPRAPLRPALNSYATAPHSPPRPCATSRPQPRP